jgi:hypothetical protein
LFNNISGINNTAIGYNSLNANTRGNNNTAIGTQTLKLNTTGSENNAIGNSALAANTTGISNNSFGLNSLLFNTIGSYNNALGQAALRSNITGNNNNAFGYQALFNNTGGNNTAFGSQALYNLSSGNGNLGMGMQTTFTLGTGSDNIGLGYQTLYRLLSGSTNVAIGYQTLSNLSSGSNNIGIGWNASVGQFVSYSNVIGYQATSNFSYSTAIGYQATNTNTSQIMLGSGETVMIPGNFSGNNMSVGGYLYCYGAISGNTITSTSDVRLKENIAYNASIDIIGLKPCYYNFINQTDKKLGFIAHEVQEIIPEAVIGDKNASQNGEIIPQKIDYSAITTASVITIQKLNKKISVLEEQLESLQEKTNHINNFLKHIFKDFV